MSRVSINVLSALIVLVLGLCCVVVQAQDREKYLISAKAGGINMVSGDVTMRRQGKTEWQRLTAKDSLLSGAVVKTGADGRIEVLLNPGSYMRVAENSEFELTDAALENLRIKLTKGSAIIEATGRSGADVSTEIITPQTKISIVKNGIYRINILPTGSTELLVRKGKVMTGSGTLTEVKDGRKAVFSGGNTEIVKFDKKDQDAFDLWSKKRAETLIAANRRLSDRRMANSLMSFTSAEWGFSGRRGFGSRFGVWAYDPFMNCYTFFPFYSGWSSPYGFGYSSNFGLRWGYDVYNPWPGNNTYTPAPGGAVGGGTTPPAQPPVAPGRRPRHKVEPGDIDDPNPRQDRRVFREDRSSHRMPEDSSGGSRPAPEPVRETPTYTPRSEPTYTPERSTPNVDTPMRPRGKVQPEDPR